MHIPFEGKDKPMSRITLATYTPEMCEIWNQSVDSARQNSFLFRRGYMDYHKDRFKDCSLLFFNSHHQVVALLPACTSAHNSLCVLSHGGLTYGGFLTQPQVTAEMMNDLFTLTIAHYRETGKTSWIYKPLPHIYQNYPSDEDLYWLFRNKAELAGRAISSTIDLHNAYAFSSLRKRKIRSADKINDISFSSNADRLQGYWALLTSVLQSHHGVNPVHTYEEISLLQSRFPKNIQLYTISDNMDSVLAGCLMFFTNNVAHVQYIAVGERGRQQGLLDRLFNEVITLVRQKYPTIRYFDFGTSTEKGGTYLNEGLIFQKQGFGARAVCYDQYKITF